MGTNALRGIPRQIFTVAGGTGIAQLINIAGVALAAALLDPNIFGAFGLHLAISAPFAILATGRFEVAFIHAGGRGSVVNLMVLAVGLTFGTTAILLALMECVPLIWGGRLPISPPLVAALVVSQSLVAISTQVNNFNRTYGVIAWARIAGAFANQAIVLLLAFFVSTNREAILPLGMIGGLAVSVLTSVVGNWHWLSVSIAAVRLRRIRSVALRHRSFLVFNGPQALASSLQEALAMSAISFSFGQVGLGHYVLLNRLLKAPVAIMAESTGRVMQRQLADIPSWDLAQRTRFVRISYIVLISTAFVFALALAFVAPQVLTKIFGSEWPLLGQLSQALSIFYAAYLVGASTASLPWGSGDYRPVAPIAIFGSALYPATLWLLGLSGMDFVTAARIVSIVMFTYFLGFVAAIYYFVVARKMHAASYCHR